MSRAAVEQRVVVDGRTFTVSHLDKVFWPDDGFTKGDLIRYYLAVAPWMLPHLRGRPLVLTRWPDGIEGKRFYQKDCPDHAPPWVPTFPFAHADHTNRYVLADSPAVLGWLAQLGVIEIHPWQSRTDAPERPDRCVFDLDPSDGVPFEEAVRVAFLVRQVLARWGLEAFPKTSGATGVHLVLPVARKYRYAELARFVDAVAGLIHRADPRGTTRERTVARRHGVYLDHLQNALGKTVAGAYSVRPRPGAPVSAPVTWDELPRVRPEQFTIATVPGRLRARGDPMAGIFGRACDLDRAMADLGVEWEGPGRSQGQG